MRVASAVLAFSSPREKLRSPSPGRRLPSNISPTQGGQELGLVRSLAPDADNKRVQGPRLDDGSDHECNAHYHSRRANPA